MHDLFEGVASREVVLHLRHCITDEKYFTLEEYNNKLVRFDYGYSETDKPSLITHRSFSQNWRKLFQRWLNDFLLREPQYYKRSEFQRIYI